MSYERVFFLSDYGLKDEFVGVVKAVLARESAHAVVIDLSHEIAPCDVIAGTRMLERAAAFVAPGVFLAVVDPGVGTLRRGIAIEVEARAGARGDGSSVLVGPDNGLLLPAAHVLGRPSRVVELDAKALRTQAGAYAAALGPTFDGRDVFAPAVALVANGASLDTLGRSVDPVELVQGRRAVLELGGGVLRAEVLWEDRFGNLQLAASMSDLVAAVPISSEVEERVAREAGDELVVGAVKCFGRGALQQHDPRGPSHGKCDGREAPGVVATRLVGAFADLAAGEVGLLVDSYGKLALVCRESSAAARLDLHPGDVIEIRRCEPGPDQ